MVEFAERAMRSAGFPPDLAAFPPLMGARGPPGGRARGERGSSSVQPARGRSDRCHGARVLRCSASRAFVRSPPHPTPLPRAAGRGLGRRAAGGPSGSGDAFGALAGGPAGPAALDGSGGGGAGGSGGGAGAGGGGDDAALSFDVPDGIDVEEARMLEAAMLGIPYTGRMPAPRPPGPALPADPAAAEQRMLRREQDDAFEESLAADRRAGGGGGCCMGTAGARRHALTLRQAPPGA
jgi:hypothetical protein